MGITPDPESGPAFRQTASQWQRAHAVTGPAAPCTITLTLQGPLSFAAFNNRSSQAYRCNVAMPKGSSTRTDHQNIILAAFEPVAISYVGAFWPQLTILILPYIIPLIRDPYAWEQSCLPDMLGTHCTCMANMASSAM